jgi:tRNA A-37 threonylcarbamoyl transferase component Bud32
VLLRDADSTADPGPVTRPSSTEIPDKVNRSARLQLFGEIARGGMGAVIKGRDSDLGRDLAVKIRLESHRDKPEMVRRFIEEAQIAGQLQHPGIVPIYELGAFGDRRPYFAMKLVKGQTLAEILANRKSTGDSALQPAASSLQPDLPRLLSIFESICQTMAYAHARGVIHRDLKPSNVMVGSFGEVQVMDWPRYFRAAERSMTPRPVIRRITAPSLPPHAATQIRTSLKRARSWERPPTWPPSKPEAKSTTSTNEPTSSHSAQFSARF